MKRSGIRSKRPTPRRRPAPTWDWEAWSAAAYVLANRSGGGCERCGTARGPFERHHRKRRRDGGDSYQNLLLLCAPCHAWITEHPLEARKAGWIVSVSRDPLEVPVLRYRNEWARLEADGTATPMYDVEDAHA